MNFKWLASAFLCTGLVYCGGGKGGGPGGSAGTSGLPAGDLVVELDTSEREQLCEYLAGLQDMPQREIDCGDGVTITVGIDPEELDAEIADCVTNFLSGPDCDATVGEAEACFEFIDDLSDDEFCAFVMSEQPPAVCEVFATCQPTS